jgi:RNA polymerase sigma-70 factor (ECF subfamily)
MQEGVELAFIAALQHLPARQRAVLIVRDVRRAALCHRLGAQRRRGGRRHAHRRRQAGDAAPANLVRRPRPGRQLPRRRAAAGATRWRLVPARANGQLAFGLYAWDDKTQTFMPRAVDVLTLRATQIQEITAFLTPDAFRNLDLPASLPASATDS